MAVILGFLFLLFIVVTMTSRRTPEEQILALIQRHQGVLVFVPGKTEKDEEFKKIIEECKPRIKGVATVITLTREQAAFLGSEVQNNLPTLIVIDAHGQELNRFQGSLGQKEKALFQESVVRFDRCPH